MSNIEVHLKIKFHSRWVEIDSFLDDLPKLLSFYMDSDHFGCCSMQGGFFITIDEVEWNDNFYVDEFWMTINWLYALGAIWDGSPQAKSFVWEQSELTLSKINDQLQIEDIGLSQIIVPLNEFTHLIIRESKKLALFAQGLRNLINLKKSETSGTELIERLQVIENYLPTNIDDLISKLESKL